MKVGDVVLIKSHGLRGFANRIGQAIVSGKTTHFTHVMLYVAPSVVIDSTPGHGVMLRNVVREVISGRLTDQMGVDGSMLVLRLADGSWDANTGTTLVSTMVHLGKKYNWGFLFPQPSDLNPDSKTPTSAFCSELVALLLNQWGAVPTQARRSSKTLPVHFDRLQRTGAWKDVTSEWADALKQFRVWGESSQYADCENVGRALSQGNQQIHLLTTLKQFGKDQETVEDRLEAIWNKHRPRKR